MKLVLLCVSVAVAVCGVASYSAGAPAEVCRELAPQHGVSGQTSAAPYSLRASAKTVKGGQRVEVVLSGKGAADTVRGFVIQARRGDQPVGTFSVLPGDPHVQVLRCGESDNTVTHKKHDTKEDRQTVTFMWQAPKDITGPVTFRGSVVKSGYVFWEGLQSRPLTVTN